MLQLTNTPLTRFSYKRFTSVTSLESPSYEYGYFIQSVTVIRRVGHIDQYESVRQDIDWCAIPYTVLQYYSDRLMLVTWDVDSCRESCQVDSPNRSDLLQAISVGVY